VIPHELICGVLHAAEKWDALMTHSLFELCQNCNMRVTRLHTEVHAMSIVVVHQTFGGYPLTNSKLTPLTLAQPAIPKPPSPNYGASCFCPKPLKNLNIVRISESFIHVTYRASSSYYENASSLSLT